MKIAQVAPLYESVPPLKYGGTERVVAYLTDELVRQGHDVTLFASGDSHTSARLIAPCERSLRLDPACHDPLANHIVMIEKVLRRAAEFDVIHFHIDYLHFPMSTREPTPHLTTLHGRLDLPELPAVYRMFPFEPVISISDSQRAPLPWANWAGTVHHGLPKHLYSLEESPEPYLAFIGRVSPEKGLDHAIEIARRAHMPLRIGAKIDRVDRDYFEQHIKHRLKEPWIDFVQEVDDKQKQELLGKASALLFPIDWPEPFGLVMIESMACGTPVVAFRRGSVPELIDEGVTGFVVDSVEAGTHAVDKAKLLDRRRCREVFERRFSAARMAHEYVLHYQNMRQHSNPPLEVRPCI